MSVTSDLAAYLATQGLGVRGTTIFRGYLPPAPNNCMCLIAVGGWGPDLIGNIDNPSVQVLVRNETYVGAESLAQQVLNHLHGLTETTIESTRYLLIHALSDPVHVGEDENKRTLFSVNFQIMYENPNHEF